MIHILQAEVQDLRRRFKDEKIESFEGKIDEGGGGMGEERAEIGTHHALPSTSISAIEFLFDMGGEGEAIGDVEEIEGVRCRGHGVNLHLLRHVGFFHPALPFQHRIKYIGCCAAALLPIQGYYITGATGEKKWLWLWLPIWNTALYLSHTHRLHRLVAAEGY